MNRLPTAHSAPSPHTPPVGTLLRDWRQRRRLSQLDLALDTDVSARHLSFIETGRATPSRDMLLRLACAGLGITWVGLQYAQSLVARGELLRVLPDWCAMPSVCWAVFPQRRLMPLRTRLFLEAMSAALAPFDNAQDYERRLTPPESQTPR